MITEALFADADRGGDARKGLVTIVAYGRPAPQGSKDAIPEIDELTGLFTGKVRLVESADRSRRRKTKNPPKRLPTPVPGKRLATWRGVVAWCARKEMRDRPPMGGPVGVNMTFTLPRGKTVKRPWPTVFPDVDKLARATLDALTIARVYTDDSQVIELSTRKTYPRDGVDVLDRSGAVIHVWQVE